MTVFVLNVREKYRLGLNSFGQYTLECVEALVAEQVNRWLLS